MRAFRRLCRIHVVRQGVAAAVVLCLALPSGTQAAEAISEDPLTLVVSIEAQRIAGYRGDERVFTSPVSTGQKGKATPTGVFSILQKRRWHRSNIYSGAPMPFMQRLTWSGIALHAGRLPGYPASGGCIRLPNAEAQRLFAMTDLNAHVVVKPSAAAPERFAHPLLFQPLPPPSLWEEPDEAESFDVAERAEVPIVLAGMRDGTSAVGPGGHAFAGPAELAPAPRPRPNRAQLRAEQAYLDRPRAPLRIYITRRNGREHVADMQRLLAELGHDPGEVDGLMGSNTRAAIRSFQKSIGIQVSGAYSRQLVETLYHAAGVADPAEAHLYVRQGFEQLFEAPVRLSNPSWPLGTHLFTALHFEDGADEVGWLNLAIEEGPDASTAQVLDRIEVSKAVRQRIAALLTPGSSLIVSDRGLGLLTGDRGTDFVVVTD